MHESPAVRFTSALSGIHTFHTLRKKRERGEGLTLEEARLLNLTLEVFEPRRVTRRGLRREPVRLDVERSALVLTGSGRWTAHAVRLALHEVDAVTTRPLHLGENLVIGIESLDGRWFYFRGRVRRCALGAGRATIALLAPMADEQAYAGTTRDAPVTASRGRASPCSGS